MSDQASLSRWRSVARWGSGNLIERAGSIRSIALLRGVAVLLVLWDHLVGTWTANHGRSWIPLRAVRDWLAAPLAIIQDFGFLGVTIFFLVSGYIISEVGVRDSRRQFALKRLLRIYPAFMLSVLLIVALDELRPHIDLQQEGFGRSQTLWAMTLLNYVRSAEPPVSGVAWSLIIEVIFYAFIWLALPLLRRWPAVSNVVMLGVVWVIVHTSRDFPVVSQRPNWFLFAASCAYLPLLLLGQSVWMWHTKRVSGTVALGLGALCWVMFVDGMRQIHVQFLPANNSYGVSVALALVVVLVALVNEHRLRVPRWLLAVSVTSYSAYLLHGPVAGIVLDRLEGEVPFTVALAAALAALAFATMLMWRFVEVPSQDVARWLSGHRRSLALRRTRGAGSGTPSAAS